MVLLEDKQTTETASIQDLLTLPPLLTSSSGIDIAFLGPTDLCQLLADHLMEASSKFKQPPYNLLDAALHGSRIGTGHYSVKRQKISEKFFVSPSSKIPIEVETQPRAESTRIQIATSISHLPYRLQNDHFILVLDTQDNSILNFLSNQLSFIPFEYLALGRVSLILISSGSSNTFIKNIRQIFKTAYPGDHSTLLFHSLPTHVLSYNVRNQSEPSIKLQMQTMQEVWQRIQLGCRNNSVSPMFTNLCVGL